MNFTQNILGLSLALSLSVASAGTLVENPIIGEHAIDSSDILFDTFNFIDQDRSESINFNELYTFMMDDNIREIQHEFKSADSNKDKLISFEESSEFDVTFEEFEQADEDGSGQVNFEEFISALLHILFKEADLNQDGHIVFSEFKSIQENDD